MSVIISLIIGEIVRPIVFGIGWVIVWLATIGLVKPRKETFYKYPVVGITVHSIIAQKHEGRYLESRVTEYFELLAVMLLRRST
jgi:hypothetical protein